ncbi:MULTISPECIES: hypothetical protein [Dyella]|uniref:Uncharacterized protein n=2 Tax=Dyella TaxID=231454 RepID=A0A4R0YQS2_9GAMM|nr:MULTISPECIES: hypothetical protein [Dyella]TBR36463.1 hypothetical protein EYV96_10990 [Dyella terrae]TCI08445.1 hypothetical protein EZM97_27880 [Dyella soli]
MDVTRGMFARGVPVLHRECMVLSLFWFFMDGGRMPGRSHAPWLADAVELGLIVLICALVLAIAYVLIQHYWDKRAYWPEHAEKKSWLWRSRQPTEVIRSTRALLFQDMRRHCPVYLVECEDGRVLCLRGEYLIDFGLGGVFPSTAFKLVRYVGCQSWFVIRPMGKGYEAEVLEVSARRLKGSGLVLKDGMFVKGWTFEAVRRALVGGD